MGFNSMFKGLRH